MAESEAGDEPLFRAVFERLGDAALVVDAEGVVIAANRAATDRLGRDLEGRDVAELSGGHSSSLMTDLKTAAGGGALVLRLRDRTGASQRLRCRVVPLPGPGGSTRAYAVTLGGVPSMSRNFESLNRELRDARERQARERGVRLATERRLRRMEDFSHHAAHDLKTPLRQIELALTFLEEDYGVRLPTEGLDLVLRAEDSCRRLQRLVGDLLERASLERHELAIGPLELDDLLDELLRDLDPSLVEVGATVRVTRPLGVVGGDAVLARQILYNLLSNAVKYRAEERPLQIDVVAERAADGMLELSVRDNGRGFDDALAETLFEPFERAGGTDVEGSGIGLASCRSACRRLGWTLRASGRPGRGAEFRLRFAGPAETGSTPVSEEDVPRGR